jgi:phosphonate transport system substrate-binding protein
MVADGLVDASAVDCQVLSIVLAAEPGLGARLRVVDTLGPAPIQPVVASGRLDAELRGQVREALLDVSSNPAVAAVLNRAGVERFVKMTDADYDPIRVLLESAREVKLAAAQTTHAL